MRSSAFRLARGAFGQVQARGFATSMKKHQARHLMSIADLTPEEFAQLVRNAQAHKTAVKAGNISPALRVGLTGQTVAMMFSKRSTRTRVSTEAAVAMMGGHPMFLGKDDIQLGVNESLYDTSKVISSMTSCMVARVGPHSDVAGLAADSAVPVINALSDDFHPLQTIADFLTIYENVPSASDGALLPSGLKVAWVGDSNNVLFDLAMGCIKTGVNITVASPKSYEIPESMVSLIQAQAQGVARPGKLVMTNQPDEAVQGADFIVTDTWVSMGQEAETKKRVKDFSGFQVTLDMMRRGKAKDDWKFMHCLPRHQEEVADEVFYSNRSLVFPEAENRLWAAVGKKKPSALFLSGQIY
jgi:ornithine carbamoyltransferase